jgi:hypothetical protein
MSKHEQYEAIKVALGAQVEVVDGGVTIADDQYYVVAESVASLSKEVINQVNGYNGDYQAAAAVVMGEQALKMLAGDDSLSEVVGNADAGGTMVTSLTQRERTFTNPRTGEAQTTSGHTTIKVRTATPGLRLAKHDLEELRKTHFPS